MEGSLVVSSNTAHIEGGGICSTAGVVQVHNGVFRNNSAGSFGGGAFLHIGSQLTAGAVIFVDNTARIGGGVFAISSSDLHLADGVLVRKP